MDGKQKRYRLTTPKKFNSIVQKIKEDVDKVKNWREDLPFSLDKACICSRIAQLPYYYVSQQELVSVNQRNRILEVPSSMGRKLLYGSHHSLNSIGESETIGDIRIFIIYNSYLMSVIMKMGGVIFISFRGTQKILDWLYNLKFSLSSLPASKFETDKWVHHGFYDALFEGNFVTEIYKAIESIDPIHNDPIYVTGHSLGAAVGAIFHAVFSKGKKSFDDLDIILEQNHLETTSNGKECFRTLSCYTLGMPRYGNSSVVEELATPFHIYNKKDVVPELPLKFGVYCDINKEYCLTGNVEEDLASLENGQPQKTRTDIKHDISIAHYLHLHNYKIEIELYHDIELYMARLTKIKNQQRKHQKIMEEILISELGKKAFNNLPIKIKNDLIRRSKVIESSDQTNMGNNKENKGVKIVKLNSKSQPPVSTLSQTVENSSLRGQGNGEQGTGNRYFQFSQNFDSQLGQDLIVPRQGLEAKRYSVAPGLAIGRVLDYWRKNRPILQKEKAILTKIGLSEEEWKNLQQSIQSFYINNSDAKVIVQLTSHEKHMYLEYNPLS